MTNKKRKTIVLVDSNALAHRAFHAYPSTLTTRKGEPTNAIFGFFTMLMQVIVNLKPESVICVFDTPARTFRDDMYEDYKANRAPMDDLLAEQMPRLIAALRESNIHTLTIDGLEADDVIGSLSDSEHLLGYDKVIVTGDRDLFQVIDEDTQVYLAGNPFSSSTLYDAEGASKRMGFDVSRIILFKALKGDPSDNIPGVSGVGDVTAIDLVSKFSSLDDIYKNLDTLKPAVKNKLINSREIAELSYKLATIKTDEDIHIDIDNFDVDRIDFDKLREIFERYEFRSLIRKIDLIKPLKQAVNAQKEAASNGPKAQNGYEKTEVINEKSFNDMLGILDQADVVAVFAEEMDDIFTDPQFLGVAVSGNSFAIQTSSVQPKQWKSLIDTLKTKTVYVYNAKYLQHVFNNWGFKDFKYSEDVMLSRFINSMGQQKETSELLGSGVEDQQALFVENKLFSKTYSILNAFTRPEGGMNDLYEKLEKPISQILYSMERAGVKLDKEVLLRLDERLTENIGTLARDIYKDAGEEFNIASPKQLSHILFEKLGIQGTKKNKSGGFSTNEKILLDHINEPIIPKILSYRELTKLKSTYTTALIEQVNPKTDRIHTTYNQAVTVTGRLSSTAPNLQNIPTNSDWGLEIRRAFVPEKGKMFVSFDYSQQELRLLAEFSDDKNLVKAFSEGFDIHNYTASRLFKVEPDKVTANQRRVAKTVNFGVVYGISSYGLAERLKISTREAQTYIDGFYDTYPGSRMYFNRVLDEGRLQGYVESMFGRRKNTELLNTTNYQMRMGAEREVINFPLQGSASDIIKKAMIDANKVVMEKYSDFAIMILQVHDEIIFEVNTDSIKDKKLLEFAKAIKKVMDEGVNLKVPMLVQVKCGVNWADLEKINLN